MDILLNPWPWYVAGPMIALVMLLLVLFGKNFGMSSNLMTMCSMAGAGKFADLFKFNWKDQLWNLTFVMGAIIGGFIAVNYLSNSQEVVLNPATINKLEVLGFVSAGSQYLPTELFGIEKLTSVTGILFLIFGGFLVGFGTRYAGGCTSGHAISGISNLQLPSLIAVIGFFIGGLVMVHLIFPFIYS